MGSQTLCMIMGGVSMAVAYNKLYELLKNVKDEKEAEELCKIIERFFEEKCREEVSKKFDEQKPIFKAELKEDLKGELATKKDLELLEERILRYVDNKISSVNERIAQLDKKMTVGFVVLILLYILTNPNAIGLIKLLFGLK